MKQQGRPFTAARFSLIGDRPRNQDRCLFLGTADSSLLGLADGLGGHPRGEVAAQLLMDVCETTFRQTALPVATPENFMLQCIGRAHQAILRFGQRQQPPIAPRTTAVLAMLQRGTLHWAHVGDSRLYLIRDGRILSQTRDHAQVRFIRQCADRPSRPRSSLTRCLGGLLQPPTTTCGQATPLRTGDTVVLCSDGLWSQVSSEALIGSFDDPQAALDGQLEALIRRAASFANSDNVSAVALRWHGTTG